MTVSVIIPVWNEESTIEGLLRALAREQPHEILVADGGSTDETAARAAGLARVIACTRGRGAQMNRAAREATGDVLLFLHADARPAEGVLRAIADSGAVAGNLTIRYDGDDGWAAAFDWINGVRCRFGIFYGDSGIFCRRDLFAELGGYQEWPILEDYEFARRLWKRGGVALLKHEIHVSDRRWRKDGVWRTMWWWFWIQGLYLVGMSPERLTQLYRNVR